MKLCFLIYSYFPYGGQQRDLLRLIQEALERGHEVRVYTFTWQGEVPAAVDLRLVPRSGLGRLAEYRNFTRFLRAELAEAEMELVIGFNKMPLLDIHFAAELCFRAKARNQRGLYYRFTPRYRHFLRYEEAVFGAGSNTEILLLSDLQRQGYLEHYPQCEPRLTQLPPGIARDRHSDARDVGDRTQLRQEMGIVEGDLLILQVGSGFRVKGVDRSLRALASLPEDLRRRCHYLLVGQDRFARFGRLSARLGLEDRVSFLSGRKDIMRFFCAADLLLHPAYEESAGYVLLEAAVAGLPVLTTATCGYAAHIEQSGAGEVCPQPFRQDDLNRRLLSMVETLPGGDWSGCGRRLGQEMDLFRMPAEALDHIERVARKRRLTQETTT